MLKGIRWYGENRLESEFRIGLGKAFWQLSYMSSFVPRTHTSSVDLQLASISANWQQQQAESTKTLHFRKTAWGSFKKLFAYKSHLEWITVEYWYSLLSLKWSTFCAISDVTQKCKFCQFTLMSFQNCMPFFLLRITKDDILKTCFYPYNERKSLQNILSFYFHIRN